MLSIDRRFTIPARALIVQCEQMHGPLEAEFDFAATRDVNALRRPPIQPRSETLDGVRGGYLDGLIHDLAIDRQQRIQISSHLVWSNAGRNIGPPIARP